MKLATTRGRMAASILTAATSALLLASLGSLACGGGGGGGGNPAPPPPMTPTAGITFTPSTAPGADAIALLRQGMSATELVLEVQANGVDNLYGLSFDLSYPAALLRLEATAEGDWLGNSGTVQTSFLANGSSAGTVIVGLTRLGPVPGRSGSGTLMTLRFTAIASGNGSISFANNEFFDDTGLSVGSISWAGGSVTVAL